MAITASLGAVKRAVPWWGKIAAKVVLSRTPMAYQFWRRMGVFVHGQMDSAAYAYRVVRSHLDRLGWTDLRDKVVIELGPGDSLFTALIARTLGARTVYLIDAGRFADTSIDRYHAGSQFLRTQGLLPPDLTDCKDTEELLSVCRAEYMTRGVIDLKTIPSATVDLVFSQAVLEHVRLHELTDLFVESRRVLKPRGVASHEVDLKDHLSYALNSLRFSPTTWESDFLANSGFYTNRVRYSQMLELMQSAGFRTDVVSVKRWSELPTARRKLHPQFRALTDEDLLVSEFDVLAWPIAS
jgi:SAM-dependent methyltransferase